MDSPQVDDNKQHRLIGHGGCGQNYQVNEDFIGDGVLKVFKEAAISRKLLQKMTERLSEGGWPAGVMPLISQEFTTESAFWITPLVGEVAADGGTLSRNLQTRLDEHPGLDSWALVKSLAVALASMHERRVAHGNLKPGNVFFSEDSAVLLSDWALGNMPGVAKFQFTDAVLYQSPEQLKDPAGYLEEKGYRWDVFAFGVLSYRLLTGKFPRCDETFRAVAPAAGAQVKPGLQADLTRVARNLERQPELSWPGPAVSPLEAEFRQWIERCLALEPMQRPVSMIEVARGLKDLEDQSEREMEQTVFMDLRRRAEHRAWRATFVAGGAVAASVLLAALWQQSHTQQLQALADAKKTPPVVVSHQLEDSLKAEMLASQTVFNREREQFNSELAASRLIGDRLFSWAMEKGNRHLPPLDGHDVRLKALEDYLTDFLAQHSTDPAMEAERARVSLQLAEIALSAGDAPLAKQRLNAAQSAWANLPENPEIRFRLASNSLLYALILQAKGEPETGTAFVAARQALKALPQFDLSSDRLNQQLAILDFHEAQVLAAQGNEAAAVEQSMQATQTLNRISEQRPDAAILRSELAACYLSSATILEGMGSLGDAREVRSLAAQKLINSLQSKPTDATLLLALAACYSAMADSALFSGDLNSAEVAATEAIKRLESLLLAAPNQPEAIARKASQLGLLAGIQRDRGKSEVATKGYDEAVKMLEVLHSSNPDNAFISFQLALLWWQQGKMLGTAGQRLDEISRLQKSADLLKRVESDITQGGPSKEQLQRSGAYLHGDLGHALQLASQKESSSRCFAEAITLWETLLRSHPNRQEYTDGLAWCRQRLADLK